MPKNTEGIPEDIYLNPVYPHSFPDPFVLKFRGEYYAYSTGFAPEGDVFAILRSRDLVNWSEVGSAMQPLDPSPPFYWAPEVYYDNGKFYLYYSTGNETLMELRVAVSERPDRGFIDSGVRLTREDFAIDAHVFVDDDGTRYLFYATDFLEHTHIGTGTVVDRMIDWFTLEGDPKPVTRAKYDWQVYDPARKEKGGVRWHTVEGPAVLKRKGKYFEMFSGGNWQNNTYGVSFAITDNINSKEEWLQFSDGEKVLPILRTIPDLVVGPGHNSIVRGPNNRELYCVYHRWTEAGRVMAIDRMDFAGDRLFVAGPTHTPQHAPFLPDIEDATTAEKTGRWTINEGEIISSSEERCEITISPPGGAFLCEYTFRFIDHGPGARAGFNLETADATCEFAIFADQRRATLTSRQNERAEIELPAEFDLLVDHLLRIEVSIGRCGVMIDSRALKTSVPIDGPAAEITFFSESAEVAFSAIELTGGFEENFDTADEIPAGFEVEGGTAESQDRRLLLTPAEGARVLAIFRLPYHAFELAANLAIPNSSAAAEYGMLLFGRDRMPVGRLSATLDKRIMTFESGRQESEIRLPEAFTGAEFRQFRIVSRRGSATAYLDGVPVAELPAKQEVSDAAVFGDAIIAVDMVRVTSIQRFGISGNPLRLHWHFSSYKFVLENENRIAAVEKLSR